MQGFNKNKRWLLKLSVTMWVSFLWASIATMLFFATFDPVEIGSIATFPVDISPSTGYSVGFFLFWFLLLVNSFVIQWLVGQDPRVQKND